MDILTYNYALEYLCVGPVESRLELLRTIFPDFSNVSLFCYIASSSGISPQSLLYFKKYIDEEIKAATEAQELGGETHGYRAKLDIFDPVLAYSAEVKSLKALTLPQIIIVLRALKLAGCLFPPKEATSITERQIRKWCNKIRHTLSCEQLAASILKAIDIHLQWNIVKPRLMCEDNLSRWLKSPGNFRAFLTQRDFSVVGEAPGAWEEYLNEILSAMQDFAQKGRPKKEKEAAYVLMVKERS